MAYPLPTVCFSNMELPDPQAPVPLLWLRNYNPNKLFPLISPQRQAVPESIRIPLHGPLIRRREPLDVRTRQTDQLKPDDSAIMRFRLADNVPGIRIIASHKSRETIEAQLRQSFDLDHFSLNRKEGANASYERRR